MQLFLMKPTPGKPPLVVFVRQEVDRNAGIEKREGQETGMSLLQEFLITVNPVCIKHFRNELIALVSGIGEFRDLVAYVLLQAPT